MSRRLVLLLATALAACDRPPPPALAVADAIARPTRGSTLRDVVWARMVTVSGTRLTIRPWDPGVTADLGSAVAGQASRFAADPQVVAVMGHDGSNNTLLTASIYEAAGLAVVVPTATAAQIRQLGPPFFMLAPTDDTEGVAMADHAIDSLGARRVAVLYVGDAYGRGVRDGVRRRLATRGLPAPAEAALTGRECRRDTMATRGVVRALLRRGRPDVLLIVLSHAITLCAIREVVAADSMIPIIASDAFEPGIERPGAIPVSTSGRIRYVTFWDPQADSLSRDFDAQVRERLGRAARPVDAFHYDGLMLISAAVGDGARSREDVVRWLASLGTAERPAFPGVTGPIQFQRDRSELVRIRALPGGEPGQ